MVLSSVTSRTRRHADRRRWRDMSLPRCTPLRRGRRCTRMYSLVAEAIKLALVGRFFGLPVQPKPTRYTKGPSANWTLSPALAEPPK